MSPVEALGGEEPHPVAGEPDEHVVRAALEVVVDVLLEGVVVHGVDRDLHATLLGEVGRLGVELLGEGGPALVGAPGDRPARGAAATRPAGSATALVTAAAGGQQARHGGGGAESQGRLDQVPPVESLPGHRGRDDSGQELGFGSQVASLPPVERRSSATAKPAHLAPVCQALLGFDPSRRGRSRRTRDLDESQTPSPHLAADRGEATSDYGQPRAISWRPWPAGSPA